MLSWLFYNKGPAIVNANKHLSTPSRQAFKY